MVHWASEEVKVKYADAKKQSRKDKKDNSLS